jgi:hypothetical protein
MSGKIVKSDPVARQAHEKENVLGKWYWVERKNYKGERERWFGCVVHEGSNYVLVRGVEGHEIRVHDDDFFDMLTHEPDPKGVIDAEVRRLQLESGDLMRQASDLTRSLGVDTHALPGVGGGNALTVPAGKRAVEDYKNALVKAQKETLPKLFGEIKATNEAVARWMAAPMLPMQAQLDGAEKTVTHIKRRIYAIELYAGLTEEVVQIADGEPTGPEEKVRLFQRRLYMDEECLVDYRAGGMEFKDIGKFDEWLLEPANLNRILPTPRCIVSMRVRRKEKEREANSTLSAFINIFLARDDDSTFLYIRNGDNVYRLSTSIDFGRSLFPDRAAFDPQRPMMAKMFASRVDGLVDRADYEERLAAEQERERKSRKWLRDNPKSTWDEKAKGDRDWANPHREGSSSLRYDRYEPFEPASVYYDDIGEAVSDRIAHYNRIALIVQGLFDRSPVFHPHHMAKVWKPEDFLRAVELVYDNSATLHAGDKPDFDAYRRELNKSLKAGSVVIGQEHVWMEREAAKYNAQGTRSHYRGFNPVRLHRPHGDPGPGFTAEIGEWKARAREAVFRWERRRQSPRRYLEDKLVLPASLVVKADRLLNVSAYKPGDFRRFYSDPRTRADYIKWAPYLLGAEDFHAGKSRKRRAADD